LALMQGQKKNCVSGFFTADSAIFSLTMVTMGFDKKKSVPTDPIILRHATGNTHIFCFGLIWLSMLPS
jgi:hypothetical protein